MSRTGDRYQYVCANHFAAFGDWGIYIWNGDAIKIYVIDWSLSKIVITWTLGSVRLNVAEQIGEWWVFHVALERSSMETHSLSIGMRFSPHCFHDRCTIAGQSRNRRLGDYQEGLERSENASRLKIRLVWAWDMKSARRERPSVAHTIKNELSEIFGKYEMDQTLLLGTFVWIEHFVVAGVIPPLCNLQRWRECFLCPHYRRTGFI